jgi:glycine cleavage system H protein
MNFPQELLYTDDHEYCKVEGDVVIVGVTEYAQEQLGDITYVELPEIGDSFSKGDTLGVIEAVKAASDIYSPVSGEVVEINENLDKCTCKTPKTWQKNVHVEHSSLKTKKIHSKSS